ncbi:hypothetical protein KKG66_04485 [bacterium]|nr:hypothetical protein [bacterium]
MDDLTIIRDGDAVRLSWSAVDGAGSYDVWQGDTPDFDASNGLFLGNTTSTFYVDATIGSRYTGFYYVLARR